MFISGPPRCGKSHLIGEILREYIRHYPKRPIYLFSQVENDRAIDNVIKDSAVNSKWDSNLFNRIDLSKLSTTDINIDEFRGKINKKTGRRFGAICIFDDIDKIQVNHYKLKLIN